MIFVASNSEDTISLLSVIWHLFFFCGVDLSAVKEIDERKLKKSVSVIVLAVEERGQTKSCL